VQRVQQQRTHREDKALVDDSVRFDLLEHFDRGIGHRDRTKSPLTHCHGLTRH
jgi:hypothetical protein